MEIKAELLKPYTSDERTNFIVQQNHRNGYVIEERGDKLVALGYTEEEKEAQRKEQIGNIQLTAADVERAIYEAKGLDFDDLVEMVVASGLEGFDVKRLKIELKANHFVRKHPYINIVGQILGYTADDMDYLFENKAFPVKEPVVEEPTEEETPVESEEPVVEEVPVEETEE